MGSRESRGGRAGARVTRRGALRWVLAVGAILAVALVAVVALVDEDTLRPRFQRAASAQLGVDVTIAGPVRIGVWPTPYVSAGDVRLGGEDERIAHIDIVRMYPAILSLFSAAPRIRHLGLNGARISAFGQEFSLAEVRVEIASDAGGVTLDPVTLDLFGGDGRGRLEADFSAESPRWRFEFALEDFELEAALQALEPEARATGQMTFRADLTAAGARLELIERSLEGTISLRGETLTLQGSDLDKRLADYESTQSFGLLDAGAVLLAGPVGLMVTKGRDFTRLLRESEGTTEFRAVASDWTVQAGVAQAQDVAAATRKNRIAALGRIDFAARRFEDLEIVLLDKRGCAVMKQSVRGPFSDPQIEEPGAIETLVGPLFELVEKGLAQLTRKECKVVYDGVIRAH